MAEGSSSPSGCQQADAVYYSLPDDGERVDCAEAIDNFEIEDSNRGRLRDERWVMVR